MPLYLLPNMFDEKQDSHLLLPEGLRELIATVDGLIAERERTGRRYVIKMGHPNARNMPIYVLNEHTRDFSDITDLIAQGRTLGLISDAGMPGVADPGSELVTALRKRGVTDIKAIPGPSSILLALVLSGLGGQNFAFHGYLPRESEKRRQVLKRLEHIQKQTHIFIETPYRNNVFFHDCCAILSPSTQLCIASQLTFPDESVRVQAIREWKKISEIAKIPTVFLFRS